MKTLATLIGPTGLKLALAAALLALGGQLAQAEAAIEAGDPPAVTIGD